MFIIRGLYYQILISVFINYRIELIVAFESLDENFIYLHPAFDGRILGIACAMRKVTKYVWLAKTVRLGHFLERFLDDLALQLVECLKVLRVDEFIAVHALSLVQIQASQVEWRL